MTAKLPNRYIPLEERTATDREISAKDLSRQQSRGEYPAQLREAYRPENDVRCGQIQKTVRIETGFELP